MRWVHDGIRAVFFDAVGTLIFPTPGALDVYRAVALRRGLSLTAAEARERFLKAYRAEEAADRTANWVTSEPRERARWHRVVTETLLGVPDPEDGFRELFDHFARPSAWSQNPDASAVLTSLRDRGIVVGMGSNYDARLWSVLDGFRELDVLRPRVVVSANVGYRKPARQFFAEVSRIAGCEPSAILFVGDDAEDDYDGSVAAGLEPLLLGSADRERHIASLAELTGDRFS